MKILTAAEIREIDRRTTEEFGIPGLLLMENAGIRVVEALERRVEDFTASSVVILCGGGNNGGDGLVVARQLIQRGCLPAVFLFKDADLVKGDARVNLDILHKIGHPPIIVADTEAWWHEARDFTDADIVIDALLGTGLTRPVQGVLEEVIDSIDQLFPHAFVVSIDLPSGSAADTGALMGVSVEADLTVTLTAPKYCLVFPPATDRAGEVVIADIGNPKVLVNSGEYAVELLLPESFPDIHRRRDPDTHKGTYGRVLVVGGSIGKSGAAAMTGAAALRAGAGLVTVASPLSSAPAIAAYMPELMTQPLPETSEGTCARAALEHKPLQEALVSASVVVIGPGVGRSPDTGAFVRQLVAEAGVPTVIDADGLYAYRDRASELDGAEQPVIITPHAGEMARLRGGSTAEVVANRLEVARSCAIEHRLYVVLKGYRTVIATPDGRVFVNPTGNAAMATAGSGDVLAGIIAALVGQPHLGGFEERLCLAVYLHGMAGDMGVEALGEECLTATDLIRFLSDAWTGLRGEPES